MISPLDLVSKTGSTLDVLRVRVDALVVATDGFGDGLRLHIYDLTYKTGPVLTEQEFAEGISVVDCAVRFLVRHEGPKRQRSMR